MEGFLCGSAGKESACHAADVGSIPGGSDGKESVCSARDPGLIPGSGRCPGEGNGNLLQYSCLRNPWTEELGYGSWGQKSWTQLSD